MKKSKRINTNPRNRALVIFLFIIDIIILVSIGVLFFKYDGIGDQIKAAVLGQNCTDYTIEIDALPKSVAGSIQSSPSGINACTTHCSACFRTTYRVTLTATARSGFKFDKWDGSCTNTNGTSPVCKVNIGPDAGSQSLTANFKRAQKLTVSTSGTGSGLVTGDTSEISIKCGKDQSGKSFNICSGVLSYNSSITLTATANSNARFTGWGGSCVGSSYICTLYMASDKTATAYFTKK